MVVLKGNFSAQQSKKPAKPQDIADQIMADLELDNLVVIFNGQRDTVVAYYNDYNGRRYFHIRGVYQKQGQWCPGKGLAMDPANAKEVCSNLGELGHKL